MEFWAYQWRQKNRMIFRFNSLFLSLYCVIYGVLKNNIFLKDLIVPPYSMFGKQFSQNLTQFVSKFYQIGNNSLLVKYFYLTDVGGQIFPSWSNFCLPPPPTASRLGHHCSWLQIVSFWLLEYCDFSTTMECVFLRPP